MKAQGERKNVNIHFLRSCGNLALLRNRSESKDGRNIEAIEKAELIGRAALYKKGEEIVIMDMGAVSNVTDYFVICSAPSRRRVQAISEGIEEALLKKGISKWHIEGTKEALWVIIDYGDVIVHIFSDKMREFYDLERLWQDAPKERFSARCVSAKFKRV